MLLHERGHALASLSEYAAEARDRNGRLVLVPGEAGVGKSTLLEHFEMLTPDARWLHGACDGLFTPRPLGPLFDVAEKLGGELFAACRADAPREDLFQALLRALGQEDELRVLAIEDVHWADESTLDLIRFLGRRVRDTTALVICTYRDDEVGPDHPLRLALGELASSRSTRRIDLAPLSEAAVRELARGSSFDADELYRLTGGNPFFVTEVLQSGGLDLPRSARDAVLARLARLEPSARHVAVVAAVTGLHVEPALLKAVTSASDADLDAIVGSGLLVLEPDGLRFRHELARLAVERELPAHRSAGTHADVLEQLLAAGCRDDARLAYHAEAARDVLAVRRHAPSAAQRAAALGSHREAAAQYERVIRFSEDDHPATLAAWYDLLVEECSLTDWERAAEAGERALELWREVGDVRRLGVAMSQHSRTLWRLCRPGSLAHAEGALALLEPLGPSRELAWAYAGAAKARMEATPDPVGIDLAHKAAELATRLDLPEVLSDALTTEAWIVGHWDGEWEPIARRAVDVGTQAGAEGTVGRAYDSWWARLADLRRYAECEQVIDEAVHYCNEHDMSIYGLLMQAGKARVAAETGQWDRALAVARPLLAAQVSSPMHRIILALSAGRVLARRGDDSSWGLLDEALSNAISSGDSFWLLKAFPAHAEAHWLAGDLTAAQADIAAALSHLHHASATTVATIVPWARRLGVDLPAVSLPAGDPAVALLAGDHETAAEAWDALRMPYEAALAYFDSGTESGFREALRRFDVLGARAAVEATRREMRALGARSIPAGARAATRAHPLGLTRREAEVLERICGGLSNADIAAELFLSARTVEHHVSSVMGKLGASTRAHAASEARRRGFVPSASPTGSSTPGR
jgi:DNA-binding CsgD family transcriptional regulator/tetratricopeptide (TPR) repeat protein